MKKLMHILFLSCLKATELIEKKMHIKLSFKENLQLGMHKGMCKACSQYEKHSLVIEKSIASIINRKKDPNIEVIELKQQIIEVLEKGA